MDALSTSGRNTNENYMPESNKGYLEKEYWDKRFSVENEYEWCKGYHEFRDLLLAHIKPSDKVLILGCGNSSLSEDLYRDGIRSIMSTDISEVVIEKMRKKSEENGFHEMRWKVADMLELPFDSELFDVVLEKGAMEVLFVDNESPWNPSEKVCKRVSKMLSETHRVLKPHGLFISISFGQPHFRKVFFEAEGLSWKMQYDTFGQGFHYFLYWLKKGTKAPNSHDPEPIEHPSWKIEMEHEEMEEEDFLLKFCLLK